MGRVARAGFFCKWIMSLGNRYAIYSPQYQVQPSAIKCAKEKIPMPHHSHKHSESHRHERASHAESGDRKFHKDWRVWLAVVTMLVAIIMYVLTLDESIVPAIMGQ
jgi:ABC-type Zn2+ transport system substrate-binding protein/surface adhesin